MRFAPSMAKNAPTSNLSVSFVAAMGFNRWAVSAFCAGRVKTFSSPKNCTQPSVIHFDATVCAYFAVSSQESIRAQPRATQNDLNGHTARTTVHAPQARIAARSGLIPTMFITRVRL